MAHVIIMPKQGQSVENCIISEFKKKVGDTVKVGDVLFGYETDKATFEEESQVEGTVLAIFWADGDEIPVLQNVMVIGNPGESFEEFKPVAAAGIPSETHRPSASSLPPAAPAGPSHSSGHGRPEVSVGIPASADIVPDAPVSPRARMLAEQKGVNTAQVAGSGPGGRIIARDVEAAALAQGHLTGLAKARMAAGGFVSPGSGSGLAGAVKGADLKVWKPSHTEGLPGEGTDYEVVKLSNMRKLIAKSMYNSLQNSAQLTHMLGADARQVQALRKKAKKALEEGRLDVNITINDFVCYAVIRALQAFPNVNSHCLGDAMRLFKCVNLGLAVDTERGLMVPAVAHAEEMDIVTLSRSLKKVADDSKKGSINPDLLSPEAASFTVSNLGGFGVEWFTPIINLPQSGILGVGTIVPRPKMVDGEYRFVPYMALSFTYDHRAIDGGEATRFLKKVAEEIENLDIDF
ncbi:MAG: 2-oxo acid dehydrogenase subunit E2 [Bacteroidales bacterium]|nr:2-oxo acid dehydrogenase subunit E2 [Bacteroidales bacterium]